MYVGGVLCDRQHCVQLLYCIHSVVVSVGTLVSGCGVSFPGPSHLRGLAAGRAGLSYTLYCRWDQPSPCLIPLLLPFTRAVSPLFPPSPCPPISAGAQFKGFYSCKRLPVLQACAKTFEKWHFTELDDSLGINAGPRFGAMMRHHGN